MKSITILLAAILRKKKKKDTRGMPRHLKAMKDVASCDKLRVEASTPRSGDFRMGQPNNPAREANPGN